jgi:hypothetical protein
MLTKNSQQIHVANWIILDKTNLEVVLTLYKIIIALANKQADLITKVVKPVCLERQSILKKLLSEVKHATHIHTRIF